ncbi:MAG TPA: RDD family protein [Pyrinomonadaceae bacterium]|nr:RDD family protein [Pyrinomonadaceae bacterium]
MQCPSCRAVYSNGLSSCPRCKTPASKSSPESETNTAINTEECIQASAIADAIESIEEASTAPVTSTLIEFPGVSRASRPQWRKELSERVREIQERRARESEETVQRPVEQPAAATTAETSAPQLGLVPQPELPEVNPIVAAALKRLERARQPSPPMQRPRASVSRGALAATARIVEEQFETESAKPVIVQSPIAAPSAKTEVAPQVKTIERERPLSVVQTNPKINVEVGRSQPKKLVPSKVGEVMAATAEEEMPDQIPTEEFYDDRAPVMSRIAGSFIDLLVVMFASSPFAAIIELTNGNWADWRVLASMGGIFLVVMFLYLTASTALMGRSWGMSLVSLHPVDADTGLPPTTKQAVGRAIFYIASLVTLGLGILYALFDAEGRTVHDHLSSTAVVRD